MKRLTIYDIDPKDLKQGDVYLLMWNIDGKMETDMAIWGGTKWVFDDAVGIAQKKRGEPDLIFSNITRGVISESCVSESMTMDEYTEKSQVMAIYPNRGHNLPYTTLGLCGEAGEFAEKVKKSMRDANGVISEETRKLMLKELSDVLWYVTACATELWSHLDEVAQINLDKIQDRSARNVLQGSGDNR